MNIDDQNKCKEAFLYFNSKGEEYVKENMRLNGLDPERIDLLFNEYLKIHMEKTASNEIFTFKYGIYWLPVIFLVIYFIIKTISKLAKIQ